MARITYVSANAVYSCCGKYLATTKATAGEALKCPSCGRKLSAPVQVPKVTIVDKKQHK